ncbi:hypothetical protein FAP39_13790 [Shimia litoralis]|uniref:Uncharacterized protein n=1 Tax=Shimia litoralis TaxID=420403 RepID=A0A4U7MXJ7_9RHOB|nr:glycosyltransferase [Shimia litoralis]TKZ17919.1 hypothetical protein FAP39_13790 [Shimia litoralis]
MIDRIFQILITDGAVDQSRFSSDLKRNIESLQAVYPDATYEMFDHDMIADFLQHHFPRDVLDTFHALTPYAFKADLARYCLLHKFGGLYSDLSYLHLRAITAENGTNMVVFRDIPGHPSWATSNAIIYAKPQAAALERAIDMIVAHHKAGYYGQHPLDPTGPYLFGRALAAADDWTTTVFGDSQLVSVEKSGRANILKVGPAGEVIAIRNKVNNCSIDELIAGHSNSYSDLWAAKRIWGETGLMHSIKTKLGRS